MKRNLIAFILLSVFTTMFAQAQTDQRTLTTKIADLLAKAPFQNAEQLEKNMTAIAEMGDKGLLEMITMLAAPGKGDNTKLEYALNGFSYYVTKPGKETLKNWSSTAYTKALETVTDKENKAFIIRQLQITGNDDAVASLKKYLSDDRLCDPATRALVKINTPSARKAIADALTNSAGNNQLTLIEGLGDSRGREALASITKSANSTDEKLKKVSLYALAHIADPSSETVLAAAAQKSNFIYDESGATTAYLIYTEQLAADGKTAQAEKIAASIIKKAKQDNQVHTRSAALKILTDIKGEKNVPALVNAMNDKNAKYREAALKYAAPYTSKASITQWLGKLNTGDNTVKQEIITMLGKKGSNIALPAVLKALQSKDGGVKSAAIKAAGQIGQQTALPALLNILKSGNDSEVEAVTNAILVMKGTDVTNQVGNALAATTGSNAKAALIKILAARAADNRIGDVLPLLKSDDNTVKEVAFSALKTMVSQNNLPQLFSLLSATDNPAEIKAVQSAVVSATSSIADTAQRTSVVLTQMKQTAPDKKYLFFNVLSGIGGKEALNTVFNSFTSGDAQTKTAVVNSLNSWPDASAAASLLQIARLSTDTTFFNPALKGYVQIAGKSAYPAEQKLLMLRNAMAIAKTTEQKQIILQEVEDSRTYTALIFAGKYLDDPALQHDAANAVMRIALSDKGWYGEKVRSLLEKSMPLLNSPDAEYERQAIRKHLAELPTGEGFVPLFNEKDLMGWKGLVANPIERSKMKADTLAKKQKASDELMRKTWFAKDGELVFGGHGENLATIKKYGDFELFVDWKILKDGDAGIYLRGSPQVQIWDTSRVDVGAQVGSGGLYNNATNPSKPDKLADNAIGEWNSFRIIMKGDRVTVYLNGVLVVNNVILENYWDRNQSIFPEEQIELQAHGTVVAYRDLYIREIPRVKPFELSDAEKKDGFKILFDGTNMYEWTGNTTDYVMEDGNIAIYPQGGSHGNLYTKKEFSDFVYRFEFQLTPGGNNGIGIRAPLEGDAAYVGMEIQVLDNDADIYKNLHDYQYHGSVYGVIPAKRGFLKPVGEWNYEEITAKGNKIKVVLNGTTILEGDIAEASKNGTLDGKDHPGLKRTTGHIGFLGHGDVVKFRNIRIKY